MSPHYHIGDDDGLVSIRVPGAIELVELYELAKELLEQEGYDHSLPVLIDLRGMRVDVRHRATDPFNHFIIQNFRGRSGNAAVVIDPAMSSELSAAIYWLACAVGDVEVFENYDQALKWLMREAFADRCQHAR